MPSRVIAAVTAGDLEATEYSEAKGILLIFAGAVGTGKTTEAARRILLAPPDGYHRARFIHASQLAALSMYDSAGLEELTSASVLVIDDLGCEFADANGAFRSKLDYLVTARHANNLVTIATTNLAIGDFVGRYGQRVVDRCREAGGFVSSQRTSMRKTLGE